MATKLLPITLSDQVYQQLSRQAREEERHPIAYAQRLLRQALEANDTATQSATALVAVGT